MSISSGSKAGPERVARIFLSYAHSDGAAAAEQLSSELSAQHDVWLDRERLYGGASWSHIIEQEIDSRDILLALLSHGSDSSIVCRGEHLRAGRKGKRLIPVRLQSDANIPIYFEAAHYVDYAAGALDSVRAAIADGGPQAKLKPEYRRTDYQTVPRLPEELVSRPEELDRLRKLLISDFGNRRVAVVALRAMGGIGKTVLAQMAGYDSAIQDAFPDGVIWCTIGENPTDAWLIEQLREAGKRLGDRMDRYDSLTGCRNQLSTVLRDKRVLLILDDVWHAPHANHFLADSPKSRVLVTTRETHVATALSAKELPLNPMSEEESRELLAGWAGVTPDSLPPAAGEVMVRCGRLPLALAMCGAMAREGHSWPTVAADLGRVEHEFAGYPHKELFSAISVSVEKLSEPAAQRYTELAVFPPDVPIPVSVLGAIWALGEDEAERMLMRLTGASLCTREGPTAGLHDVQHAWCTTQLDKTDARLGLIQGAIRLSSHVLARDPKALPGQLIGRLLNEKSTSIQTLLLRLRNSQSGPWLQPLTGSLTPPGGPLLRTLQGHSHWVSDVAVSPDGRRAVSASSDCTLKVWDLETGRALRTLEGHSSTVFGVAVSPDGRRVVSSSGDQTIRVWDLESGHTLRTLEGHSSLVSGVAVSPDGQRAVSASEDCTLRVWDLKTGRTLRTLEGHSDGVHGVAVSPDGGRAVSASLDKTLKVWDLETGRTLHTLKGHSAAVTGVAVFPDGRRAISASRDDTLKVWNLETGRTLRTLKGNSDDVLSVAVSPDGRRAVSACQDSTLKVWDLETGRTLYTLEGHSSNVDGVAVCPDGRRAVSASSDGTLKVWDLESRRDLRTSEGHSSNVTGVAVTPDGRRAVSTCSNGTLKVWDLETRRALRTLQGHTYAPYCVALSPDGRRAVSGCADGSLKVWDLDNGRALRTLEGHLFFVTEVAVTPDGRRAVSASEDKTLRVWDLETGRALRTLEGHSSTVYGVAVTLDGRRAISASEDKTLRVWDLETGRAVSILEGHSSTVYGVAVTPDGRRAVSACQDSTLKVWDLETGRTLHTLEGHFDSVDGVSVSLDGRRAVSASSDHTLKTWNLENGEALATFAADAAIGCCALAGIQTVVAGDALGHVHFLRLVDGSSHL